MIRVFTQSPDMIADMIWIHFITLSYQCLQNLSTRGHDMVDEVLFKKKRRFSLTKTTSTKIGDEMKTYDRGFLKAPAVMVGVSPEISHAYFNYRGRG